MEKFSTKWRDLAVALAVLSILFLGLSILLGDFTVFLIFIGALAGLFVLAFTANSIVAVLCFPILWVSSRLIEGRQMRRNPGKKKP